MIVWQGASFLLRVLRAIRTILGAVDVASTLVRVKVDVI